MPSALAPSSPSWLCLDAPAWLAQALAPFRIAEATLSPLGELRLVLASERVHLTVLVDLHPQTASPRVSLQSTRLSREHAAAFLRSLTASLARTTELRPYLERLAALAAQLGRGKLDDLTLEPLRQAWGVWPKSSERLAEGLPDIPLTLGMPGLGRGAEATLVLYHLAHNGDGDSLRALSVWAAWPQSGQPSFVERLVRMVLLALLGRRDEAVQALMQLEASAGSREEMLAVAQAYEQLEQPDRAAALYERTTSVHARAWDRLRIARARGDFAPFEPIPQLGNDVALSDRVDFARQLVHVLEAAGRYEEALTHLNALLDDHTGDEKPLDLSLRAATLHLWKGETDKAHARLVALGPAYAAHEGVTLLQGAAAVLEGDPVKAISLLGERKAGPTQLEHLLWRAEAHLALGDLHQAAACVQEHIKLEGSLIANLLWLLVKARTQTPESFAKSLASPTFLDGLVGDVLPTLCAPELLEAANGDPQRLAALVRSILDAMGGNRSRTPTWARPTESGQRQLVRVQARPSGREAAVAKLVQIKTEPPDRVLSGFDEAIAAYPHSPHPWTYRGELLLWLGRYEDALQSFAEADARALTRWSFIGRAAAYELLGDAEQAERWTRLGAERFGEVETATTHVYRGERLRRIGDLDTARKELLLALRHKTKRIGARLNLALVYRAQGDEAAYERELIRLRKDAPAFLWEAGVRDGMPIHEGHLLRALDLMVGNRSSFLHTMRDQEGRFRIVPDPSAWVHYARRWLRMGAHALEREIGTRFAGG